MTQLLRKFWSIAVGLYYQVVYEIVEFLMSLLRRMHGAFEFKARIHHQYKPRANDIFIVTFPKSGTTWMQMILYQLTTSGNDFDHINDVAPFFEMTDGNVVEKLQSPRLLKSHLSYDEIPKTAAKYIYVTRDIKDVIVSCYHHHRSIHGFQGSFDEFFELYQAGKIYFKDWGLHVSNWMTNKNNLDVLFLNYEDLVAGTESSIKRIIKFLNLRISEAEMDRIIERTSFAYMKKHEDKFDVVSQILKSKKLIQGNFIRNGKVAKGEGYLNVAQKQLLREEYVTHLSRNGLKYSFE